MGAQFWTNEKLDQLVMLWNEGYSSKIVAEKIGCTKSAVVGKVARLRDTTDRIMRKAGEMPDLRLSTNAYVIVTAKKARKRVYTPRKRPNNASASKVFYRDTGLPITTAWPISSVDKIIKLWSAGNGEGAIASEMARTLKSVKGKIDQLSKFGLIKRRKDQPITNKRGGWDYRVRDENRIAAVSRAGMRSIAEFEAEMPQTGITLFELKYSSCRWPTGDNLYCGETKEVGSYCMAHGRRAYDYFRAARQVEGRAA